MSVIVEATETLAATLRRMELEGLPPARVEFDPDTATESLDDEQPALWIVPAGHMMDSVTRGTFQWAVEADVILARRVSKDRREVPAAVGLLEQLAGRLVGIDLVDDAGAESSWVVPPESVQITTSALPEMLYRESIYIGALTVALFDRRIRFHA